MVRCQRVTAGWVVWVVTVFTAPARLIFDFFGNFGPIGRVVIHYSEIMQIMCLRHMNQSTNPKIRISIASNGHSTSSSQSWQVSKWGVLRRNRRLNISKPPQIMQIMQIMRFF
jgi:hypothetical protein